MGIYLGVDGGGSKTFALAADATGRVIGFGQAGRANHQGEGLDAALREIGRACRQALGKRTATFASFCLAGADLHPDFAMLRPAIEALDVTAAYDLRNDAWAAMRAGSSHPWGAVVICGSGINAAVRSPDGREFILPCLGGISGDWGGGGDMALAAIGAVARAWDGRGPATALTERVLARFGMASYEALLEALYTGTMPKQRITEIAPLIFEAALAGDAVAQEIIVRTGTEIGHAAGSLLRRLDMHRGPCEVVTGGSIFKGVGPLLLDAANLSLHRLAPLARFTRATVEPVVGALLLAIELHGQTVDSKLMARLHETMPAHLFTHR
ncbi:MAG TPA: BadF/BadG/BcrA/BcrD ATPase family protein [Roseiflexaceae bacterium]